MSQAMSSSNESRQQHLQQRSVKASDAFFLSLTDDRQNSLSLQQAFQQHKSSFIEQSNERLQHIARHHQRVHQRIIPPLRPTDNSFLQEKRQMQYERLCQMIIKHQNRKEAKIYADSLRHR